MADSSYLARPCVLSISPASNRVPLCPPMAPGRHCLCFPARPAEVPPMARQSPSSLAARAQCPPWPCRAPSPMCSASTRHGCPDGWSHVFLLPQVRQPAFFLLDSPCWSASRRRVCSLVIGARQPLVYCLTMMHTVVFGVQKLCPAPSAPRLARPQTPACVHGRVRRVRQSSVTSAERYL